MLKIGITGGIGSGKSTVCRIFESLSVPVFYADTVAKQIMVTDQLLIEGITAAFGEESYHTDGRLNNKYIAGIVFNDDAALNKLNALVHPATFRAFDQWLSAVPAGCPYILKEAALLFESGSYKLCDKSILVTAPLHMKLARVMQRGHTTAGQVRARMDKQLSDEVKQGLSDFIIRNDGTESVILRVLELHQRFLRDNN